MMSLERVIWPRPIKLASIRSPDVDFCFIGEYNTFPIIHNPMFMSFGPFIPRFSMAIRKEGLVWFDLGLESHAIERSANSSVRNFIPLLKQIGMNFGRSLPCTSQNIPLNS